MMQWDKLMRQPLCRPCLGPLAAFGIGAGIGGLFGGSSGGNTTVTQQTIPTRPTLTPEEEALRNYFIDMVYGNVGAGSYPGSLLSNYLYGSPITGGQLPVTGGLPQTITGTGLRQQYEGQIAADQEAAQKSQISELLKEYMQWETGQKSGSRIGAGMTNMQVRAALEALGVSHLDAERYLQEYPKNQAWVEEHIRANYLPQAATPAATTQAGTTTPQPTTVQPSLPGQTPTMAQAGTMTQPTASELPTTSPLAQIMGQTPESITGQYDILKQQLEKQVNDWYQQAVREVEERGISKGGGYLGSRLASDYDAINAKRQEYLQQGLQDLNLAQMQSINQLPYQQLSTLEPIRQWEANYGLSAQQPWTNIGQQFLMAPWGQATTSQQSLPGVGVIPGAISGATTAAGLSALGQQLGWWGGAATPSGLGLSGLNAVSSYASSPLTGTGLQGVWNSYIPGF